MWNDVFRQKQSVFEPNHIRYQTKTIMHDLTKTALGRAAIVARIHEGAEIADKDPQADT